ncbi:MAG: molybdopterin-synthase adenylyltransferase MoeB [Pseudomonadota bacterium]
MNDEQLLRYNRQMMLPQLDYEGQSRLLESRVLIIGLGGLGSPVAMYLAAGGVGHLVLADFDTVDLSNLQRQIIHTTESIGRPKVESARDTLRALNPETTVTLINERMDESALHVQIEAADVVIDASDNFETRFAVNQICVQTRTPLVSGAVIRMEGQVFVVDPRRDDAPCYRCLYQEEDTTAAERCSATGVLAPLPGIIGCIQATEAMKLIARIGQPLVGKLLLLDAMTMEWRTLRFKKEPQCPVCSGVAA